MEQNNKYEVENMMAAILAQRSMDFEDHFKSAMQDRVAQAVDDRKLDLAQTLFRDQEPVVTGEE
jgi:hypothetical protein